MLKWEWEWDILRGTLNSQNPLSMLRGNGLILSTIFDLVNDFYARQLDSRAEDGWMSIRHGVVFPKASGVCVNMMPIQMFNRASIPDNLVQYIPMILSCPVEYDPHQVVYLTVHEGLVMAGSSQRRRGIHIERPGALRDGGSVIPPSDPRYRGIAWGLGRYTGDGLPKDGIYMVSNISASTMVYPVLIKNPEDVTDVHGGVEHLRGRLGEGYALHANEMCWMTDRTPHEAMQTNGMVYRQFFRLVVGRLSIWLSRHNTANPTGFMPPVPICDDDKFEDERDKMRVAGVPDSSDLSFS